MLYCLRSCSTVLASIERAANGGIVRVYVVLYRIALYCIVLSTVAAQCCIVLVHAVSYCRALRGSPTAASSAFTQYCFVLYCIVVHRVALWIVLRCIVLSTATQYCIVCVHAVLYWQALRGPPTAALSAFTLSCIGLDCIALCCLQSRSTVLPAFTQYCIVKH